MTLDRTLTVDATVQKAAAGGAAGGGLVLRVLNDDAVRVVPLAPDSVVELGRSPRADVTIDAPTVSRIHARLHVGKTLQIEDVGSANGTKARGVALARGQRVDVLPGDEVFVGDVLCVVLGGARFVPPPRLRSLRSHEYFEARLDDECALLGLIGPAEVVAWYGPGDYEVLLPGEAPRREGLVAELVRAGWEPSVGAARFGIDGRTPDALIEVAGAALRSATPEEAVRAAGAVVVEDPAMRNLYKLLKRFAASDISVLLGETGTGKEVFASQLHQRMASSKFRGAPTTTRADVRSAPPAPTPPTEAAPARPEALTLATARPLSEVLDEAEKDYVRRVLDLCLNNQTRAAEVLDVSRGKIVNLIEKHKLPRPRGVA